MDNCDVYLYRSNHKIDVVMDRMIWQYFCADEVFFLADMYDRFQAY